jgi:hypothetical protein
VDFPQILTKLPEAAIHNPFTTIGLAVIVIGLPKGVDPSNAYLPCGLAFITFQFVHTNFTDCGFFRRREDDYKLRFTWRPFFWCLVSSVVLWFFVRWWLIDVHFTNAWMRAFFWY